nr:hypothetical protein Iba_chr10bCG12960 [Ipomoea batatas]
MPRRRREIHIFSLPLVSSLAIPLGMIKLIIQVIKIIFLIIPINPWTPFLSLVSSFALGTCLISIFALILITSPANRKGTLITRNKCITTSSHPNSITTNLTYLTIQILKGFWLHLKIMADSNQLIPLVRSGNHPSTGLHFFPEKQRTSRHTRNYF